MDLFLKNKKSSVLETFNTLAIPLVFLGSDMWNFFPLLFLFFFQGFWSCSQNVEMYRVYECIATSVVLSMHSQPALGYEATCVYSNTSGVKHSHGVGIGHGLPLQNSPPCTPRQ